jgi:hypothetical protein
LPRLIGADRVGEFRPGEVVVVVRPARSVRYVGREGCGGEYLRQQRIGIERERSAIIFMATSVLVKPLHC